MMQLTREQWMDTVFYLRRGYGFSIFHVLEDDEIDLVQQRLVQAAADDDRVIQDHLDSGGKWVICAPSVIIFRTRIARWEKEMRERFVHFYGRPGERFPAEPNVKVLFLPSFQDRSWVNRAKEQGYTVIEEGKYQE